MSRTYDVQVTILNVDIQPKAQKILQKLKSALEHEYWAAGNVSDENCEVEMFKKETLKQDLHIYYHSNDRIAIKVGGSEIDRDNLALIEKILKQRAEIEVKDGKLRLDFRSAYYSKPDPYYTKFGKYNNINDIPMNIQIDETKWKVEIHGYTRKGREYS